LYFGDHGLLDIRDRVELVVADMRSVSPDVLDDVETVINVGGLSNDPTAEYNPRANYEMNVTAALNLADMARAHGVRRYIYASSCSIYDRGVADEERDVMLDETAVVNPQAAYSASKYAAEGALLPLASSTFCAAHGDPVRVLAADAL
jgi:nucleoside-diphosphate-sugar epimerase